jgi:pimeloyl-ACP methyl ester carboxylesterase
MVALDWCARFHGDFERCVVVSSSTRRSPRADRFSAGAVVSHAPALLGRPGDRARAVLRLSSNAPLDDALARSHARWAAERPITLPNLLRQLVAASRFELPPRIETPTFVMSSTGDRLVSWRCSEAIARALSAPLALHPSAGHDLTLDAPDWVAAQVAQWLAPTVFAAKEGT